MKYSLSEPSWASGSEALEGARRDDGQRRDRPAGAAQDGRRSRAASCGVDLAVEDGQRDVAPDVERLLELTRILDLDDLEAGREQLG